MLPWVLALPIVESCSSIFSIRSITLISESCLEIMLAFVFITFIDFFKCIVLCHTTLRIKSYTLDGSDISSFSHNCGSM